MSDRDEIMKVLDEVLDQRIRQYLDRDLQASHLHARTIIERSVKPGAANTVLSSESQADTSGEFSAWRGVADVVTDAYGDILGLIDQTDTPGNHAFLGTDDAGDLGWYTLGQQQENLTYSACMYAANSGSPTHTVSGYQKVGSGGGTLTWTEDWEVVPDDEGGSMLDLTTNKRIDILKDGVYAVYLAVAFNSISASKRVSVSPYVNGSQGPNHSEDTSLTTTYFTSATFLMKLSDGDYIEPYVFQNDSTSEAYNVSSKYNVMFAATRLGPHSNVASP